MSTSAGVCIGGEAPKMLAVLWGLTALTLVFVILRLYTRIRIVQRYGLDDHCFNASFVALLVYDIMMTISSFYGFGRDMDEILVLEGPDSGGESIARAILYSAIGQTILVLGTVLSKTSLALFLIRLSTTRIHKIAIWAPSLLLSTGVAASLFVFWFSCQPAAYLWDRRIEGECSIDPGPIATYAGSWSVILDFWYAGLPWWLLRNLQMPRREKYVISGSMSLGVIAGACGVKRAMELSHLGSPNYLRDVVGIIIWHAAELCTTLICIGIPVCRPLYKDWIAEWSTAGRQTGEPSSYWIGGNKDGIFAMHTIGGSKFKGNGIKNVPSAHHRHDEGCLDNLAGRDESVRRTITIGRTRSNNTSGESILEAVHGDGSNCNRHTGCYSIRVYKQFRVESHPADDQEAAHNRF